MHPSQHSPTRIWESVWKAVFVRRYEEIIHEPWYDYFIPPSSGQTLLSTKYFELKFAIMGRPVNIYTSFWSPIINKYIQLFDYK